MVRRKQKLPERMKIVGTKKRQKRKRLKQRLAARGK